MQARGVPDMLGYGSAQACRQDFGRAGSNPESGGPTSSQEERAMGEFAHYGELLSVLKQSVKDRTTGTLSDPIGVYMPIVGARVPDGSRP